MYMRLYMNVYAFPMVIPQLVDKLFCIVAYHKVAVQIIK